MNRDERQELAIERWKKAGGRGIILAATGFGKTRLTLNIIQRLIKLKSDAKVIIVVPSEYLKKQWIQNAVAFNVHNNVSVYVINTASKLNTSCTLMVVDECHTSVSTEKFSIYKNIKSNLLLCLTATLTRLDGLEQKLLDIVPIVDEVTLEDAIKNQWVAPYKQYKVMLNVDLEEYEKINVKFNHHFASFDYNFNAAMRCLSDSTFRAQLANATKRTSKELLIHAFNFNKAMQLRKTFINDHLKKIEIANKIIRAREEAKIITFTKQINHAEMICCGDIYHGKLKAKEKKAIIDRFTKAKTGVINTCKSFDLGNDVEGVNTAIILSGDSSNTTKKQRIGRAIRFAPGRVGEIWSLVIKGTVEENWFNKANGNLEYETIEDYQLDDLLNGKELKESETEFKFVL